MFAKVLAELKTNKFFNKGNEVLNKPENVVSHPPAKLEPPQAPESDPWMQIGQSFMKESIQNFGDRAEPIKIHDRPNVLAT